MTLGQQIKKEREKLGLTEAKFGHKIETTGTHVKTLENGTYMPSVGLMQRICTALNVSIEITPKGITIKQE